MTIDFTLLVALSLVGYVGYEYFQETNPFQPVLKPFDDIQPVVCHPAEAPSGFNWYLVWYQFRVRKVNKSDITTPVKHEHWEYGGINFFDCLSQLQEDIRKINKPATWDPQQWCLLHCWEYSTMDYGDGSSDNKNLKLINKQTGSSTLGHPAFCERGAWDLKFPDE